MLLLISLGIILFFSHTITVDPRQLDTFMPFLKKTNTKTRYNALTILALTIIVIVLFFGLRPKIWPIHNVPHWISGKNALRFNNPGIAFVDDIQRFNRKQNSDEFTIHMSVSPESFRKRGFRPILMLHDGDDHHQLTIWHWGASIIAMNGNDYDNTRKWPRISAKNALSLGETSFITVTSSDLGTRLFVNGLLAKADENWQLTVPDDGKKLRLILGNSVYGKHGWNGEIYGLALYGKALSPEEVKSLYERSVRESRFLHSEVEDLLLLFTFTEDKGHLIPDKSGHNLPLQLSSRSIQFKKTFLSAPWHNFNPNKSFFVDAILNLIGFIPLGTVTYCWLRQSHLLPSRYETTGIVVFCFSLSLSMEILQAWLPNRSSSLLDLSLNTLGAWLGVLLLGMMHRIKMGRSIKND